MTVLYTKYKAENNALLTIYVKYGLKIYREVWKFESEKYGILKWKMCRNNITVFTVFLCQRKINNNKSTNPKNLKGSIHLRFEELICLS